QFVRWEIEPPTDFINLKRPRFQKLRIVRRNAHLLIRCAVIERQQFVLPFHALMFGIQGIAIALLGELRWPGSRVGNHAAKGCAIAEERSAKAFSREAEPNTLARFPDDAVPGCPIPTEAWDVQHIARI